MQLIERKKGSFKSLLFNVNLTAIDKLYSDVEEIFFIIKENLFDDDDSALMNKDTTDGITIDSNCQVIVPWTKDEYIDFIINKEYFLGLFLKFTGDPAADEDVKETFKIKIIQDFLHDQ